MGDGNKILYSLIYNIQMEFYSIGLMMLPVRLNLILHLFIKINFGFGGLQLVELKDEDKALWSSSPKFVCAVTGNEIGETYCGLI